MPGRKSRVNRIGTSEGVCDHALAIVRQTFPDVKAVQEGDKDIHLELTNRDQATAKRKSHEECALAYCAKRTLGLTGKGEGVLMARSTAYIVQRDKSGDLVATRYKVPQRITREMVSFDRGAGFESGEYKLNAPAENQKLGHVKRRNVDRPNNPDNEGKIAAHRHVIRDAPHRTMNIRTRLGWDKE